MDLSKYGLKIDLNAECDNNSSNVNNIEDMSCFDALSYLKGYSDIQKNMVQGIFEDDKLVRVEVDGKTIDFKEGNKISQRPAGIFNKLFSKNFMFKFG